MALHFATNIKEIRICIKECVYFDLIPRCYHISVQEYHQHFQYRLQKLSIILLFLTVWIDPCERSMKINVFFFFPVNVTSLKVYHVTSILKKLSFTKMQSRHLFFICFIFSWSYELKLSFETISCCKTHH